MDSRNYIWGIPDIIFSGVLSAGLGAAIALFGTWLQGRKQAKLQTTQLTHDATEKAKEREMSLRRDRYLPAAEAIAKLQEYLKSYSILSMTNEERTGIIRNVWGIFNKIAIIASIDTIETFDKLYLRFSQLDGPLVLKHLRLYQLDQEVNMIRDEQEQLIGELHPTTDPLDLESSERMTALQETIESQFQTMKNKRLEMNDLRFEIVSESGKAVAELETLMAEANIRIRNELNLPIDEVRYMKSVTETYRLMQEAGAETIAQFQKQVPEAFERLEDKKA